jgi:hypothetical protein
LFTVGAERPLSKLPKEIDAMVVETAVQEQLLTVRRYLKCGTTCLPPIMPREAQESTKLPAGASYTCPVQGTSKEEEELAAVTRLTGSGVMRGERTS